MAQQVCTTYRNNTFKTEEKFPELHAEIQILRRSQQSLSIEDYGAGSKKMEDERLLSDIYTYNCTKGAYARMLHLLPQALGAKTILELGTSLGISTFYLSQSPNVEQVVSVEGSQNLSVNAEKRLKRLGVQNVRLVHLKFQEYLDAHPDEQYDLVYLDGHHSGAATVHYCSQLKDSMQTDLYLLLDDIRWSRDMYRAYQTIRKWPEVKESMDLARMGLIHLKRGV